MTTDMYDFPSVIAAIRADASCALDGTNDETAARIVELCDDALRSFNDNRFSWVANFLANLDRCPSTSSVRILTAVARGMNMQAERAHTRARRLNAVPVVR